MDQRKVDVEQGVEATQTNKPTLDVDRRHALKKIVVGGGVAAGLTQLPTQWVRPVVDKVMVPAHAQTSEPSCEPTGFFEEVVDTSCQGDPPSYRIITKVYTIYVDDEDKCEVGYEYRFEAAPYKPAKGGYALIRVNGDDDGVSISAKGYDEDDVEIWSYSPDPIDDPCEEPPPKIGARLEGIATGEITINNVIESALGVSYRITGNVSYSGIGGSDNVVIGPLNVGPA